MRLRVAEMTAVRRLAALVLFVLGFTLLLSACGRIPESESAKSLSPTATPIPAAGSAQTTGGTSAMSGGGSCFKPAEMPAGNPTSGQTVYISGCQNCHGAGGTATDPKQVSLATCKGLLATKSLDTAEKFTAAFNNNAIHADIKDNPSFVTPQRLINMYAYLVGQISG